VGSPKLSRRLNKGARSIPINLSPNLYKSPAVNVAFFCGMHGSREAASAHVAGA
jgi:hypothetical protein